MSLCTLPIRIELMELFDIVDEQNNPLGFTKLRDEVHKNLEYWHRTTHIWVVNDQGQILCQQRSLKKDANPGKWQSFFGGHLQSGESYEESAINELREELGVVVDASQLTPIYIRKNEASKHFGQVYVFVMNKKAEELEIDKEEVEKVEWINLKNLEEDVRRGGYCNGMDGKVVAWLKKPN